MSSLTFSDKHLVLCVCSRQTSSARQKGTSAAPRLQSGPGVEAGENHRHHQNHPAVGDGRVGRGGFVAVPGLCWSGRGILSPYGDPLLGLEVVLPCVTAEQGLWGDVWKSHSRMSLS